MPRFDDTALACGECAPVHDKEVVRERPAHDEQPVVLVASGESSGTPIGDGSRRRRVVMPRIGALRES